jgi:(p)ppGpp synthase/HD superfamily hydrolase
MRVVDILVNELGIEDTNVLALAFVHDVFEDGDITEESLMAKLGAPMGLSVMKLSKNNPRYVINGKFDEEIYWQVIEESGFAIKIVKLADRLDNIRDYDRMENSLQFHGNIDVIKIIEKRRRYMTNTKEYVLPIAKTTNEKIYGLLKEIVDRYI